MTIDDLSPALGECTGVLLLCLLFNHRTTHSHWKYSAENLACCWVQQVCIFKGEKKQNCLLLPTWKGYKKTSAAGAGGTGMRNGSVTLPCLPSQQPAMKGALSRRGHQCQDCNAAFPPFPRSVCSIPGTELPFQQPSYFWCFLTISSWDQPGFKIPQETQPEPAPAEQNGSAGLTWKTWKAVLEELQAITLLHT